MRYRWIFFIFFALTASLSWSDDTFPLQAYVSGPDAPLQTTQPLHLMLGMFSLHTKPSSFKSRNWNQKLIGFQVEDYFVCTFKNSFYNRSYACGIAKDFSGHRINSLWETSLGYRLGLIYGYDEGQAPFSSFSPVIPLLGIYNRYVYHEHLGIEFMLTTTASVSFFYPF
jgi:hypothetical protein